MTELLLLMLIIILTGSFFSLQKKMNLFILPAGADRSSPQANNAWFATTCAGYTISRDVEVVYHQQEKTPTGKKYRMLPGADELNSLSADI
ncbi:MAG: hypothetical protein KIT80_19030 [Chitinophagaceae bacterium]|nr:hypothetical protein [Chitinophagaceae bacterium]MCW5929021.1 hypothetical protein [Chitinophagaceae bacterium]